MLKRILVTLSLALAAVGVQAGSQELCGTEAAPCVRYGAQVFQERCSLCHGSDGLGEGILPLSLKGYPDTNLMEPRHATDRASLEAVIQHGNAIEGVSPEMPPWGDELTATQLDSVVLFTEHMRADFESALAMLRQEASNVVPNLRAGRAIYQGRCALCHGATGHGDGKMSRIIKEPPPFNLTASVMPDVYLREIISKGGELLGRSPRMPPWGGDLTPGEIDSVILYITSLRE